MKNVLVLAVVLSLLVCGTGWAAVTIDVYASSAPNASGSASWAGYVNNAIYAIENGLASYGDTSLPTAYERAADVIDAGLVAVTSFASWQGDVNPTGAFASEYGNRLHFGLRILGNGEQFSISQLSFVMSSSDTTNSIGISYPDGYNYNSSYVGINYGTDGIKGTSDDVRITSGASTQLVDELVGRGTGNAWWPGGSLADRGASDPQAAMDTHLSWFTTEAPITITGVYSLGSASGSDSVQVVPEPATMALLTLGGLLLRRKK